MALDTNVMGATEDPQTPTHEPSLIDTPGSIWLSPGVVPIGDSRTYPLQLIGVLYHCLQVPHVPGHVSIFRALPNLPRWRGLHTTYYSHMHTSRRDVCLGVRGYGGMYVILVLSCLCRGLHLSRGRAPNVGSSLRNKCHLYSAHLANLALKAWMV